MGILQLLAKENYIAYSKPLAKAVGIDEAILFGALCSVSNIHGNEFFYQQERLCEDTCLTEYRLRNAIKNLKKAGLLSVEKKGLPARNYYKLNENKFLDIMNIRTTSGVKFDTTGDSKIMTTGSNKFDSTYKKTSIENINKKSKKESMCYDSILSEIGNEELRGLYIEYIKMRKLIKAPLTNNALKTLIDKVNQLEPNSVENQKLILKNSILNNWKDVFALKKDKLSTSNSSSSATQTVSYNLSEYENNSIFD